MFDLRGKVAIITGAAGGLGSDAARAFAQQGVDLALLDIRKDALEQRCREIEATDIRVLPIQCDVANEDSVKNAIETVLSYFGKVDILLNAAGIAIRGGVTTLTEEEWDKSMNVNVKGMYFTSKYVVPHMIEQKYGKIVNFSSVNALLADKAETFIRHSYNASKGAVIGLTRGMAASYAKYGITVNAVCPGLFESEMTADTLFKSEEFLAYYSHMCPVNRVSNKGELNGTILYLSSDASSYVTGQYIMVDGGSCIV